MHEQLQEQLKKQQEVIENLQQNKNEFTVPQKPVRKQSTGFKVFSEENSLEAMPNSSTLDDTKALLQRDPLGKVLQITKASGHLTDGHLAEGTFDRQCIF